MKSFNDSTLDPATPEDRLIALLYSWRARALSLLLAIALTALLLASPSVLIRYGQVNFVLLSLWMWVMTTAYVHGVGYLPRHVISRILFCPFYAWVLAVSILVWFMYFTG